MVLLKDRRSSTSRSSSSKSASDAIRAARDWLRGHHANTQMPGGKAIFEPYERFRAQLAVQAKDLRLDPRKLTFGDYTRWLEGWLRKTPW